MNNIPENIKNKIIFDSIILLKYLAVGKMYMKKL
uniref:Uncharacterized protein n=1 Tax=Florenciella sp. virus SA2 TaxID=3240092 RepID=A0AB39JF30_9VIRU